MDSLINKPVYTYTNITKSQVNAYGKTNCCFISSFQIQMKNHFNDFPDLKTLLNLLYANQSNAYTHFAYDFPQKWHMLKTYLCNQNNIWADRFDNILLHICLPLAHDNQCVQLAFINLNTINSDEIILGNYASLESSFIDDYNPTKLIISIIQYAHHFEPIDIDFTIIHSNLESTKDICIDPTFFD